MPVSKTLQFFSSLIINKQKLLSDSLIFATLDILDLNFEILECTLKNIRRNEIYCKLTYSQNGY
jgi:hypothetical protein